MDGVLSWINGVLGIGVETKSLTVFQVSARAAVRRNNPALHESGWDVPAARPPRSRRSGAGTAPLEPDQRPFATARAHALRPGVRSVRQMPASAARPVTPPAKAAAASARARVPPRRASATGPCSAAPPPPSGGHSPPPPHADGRRTGTSSELAVREDALLPHLHAADAALEPRRARDDVYHALPPRGQSRRGSASGTATSAPARARNRTRRMQWPASWARNSRPTPRRGARCPRRPLRSARA